jgi:hypothetical protein
MNFGKGKEKKGNDESPSQGVPNNTHTHALQPAYAANEEPVERKKQTKR